MRLRWVGLALVLGSVPARAELDTFKTGDGHRGALVVPVGTTRVINPAALLVTSAPSGARTLELSAPFALGDVLLLLTAKGLSFGPDAGDAAAIPLDGEELGASELVRVASVVGTTVTLTLPLARGFQANVTQAVLVPEYTAVTVQGQLVAQDWDGGTGGVVGFFASDTLNLTGTVSATGAGYRGGPSYLTNGGFGAVCRPSLETRPADGGLIGTGPKGEGAALTAFPFVHGGGNLANGGGGGMCHESGGGGGGHLGGGGRGGLDQNDTPGGGLGGAPFSYVPGTRLVFGGGGGTGEYHHPADTPAGAAGGGVVFVRARAVIGTGVIAADGRSAGGTFVDNGGGGAGAGGTVVVRVFGDGGVGLVQLSARGGTGGSVAAQNGPGGGGGGGAVFVHGGSAPTDVSAGLGGGQRLPDGGLLDRAATPTAATVAGFAGGSRFLVEPAKGPLAPVLTSPGPMAVTGPRPLFEGTAAADAGVYVFVDGLLVAQTTTGPFDQFSVPAALDLANGSHRARAQAVVEGLAGDRGNEVVFTVSSSNPPGLTLTAPRDGETLADPWVTYRGTGTPAALVTVKVDGTPVGSGTAVGGLFAVQATAPLPDGPHVARAESEDGGVSAPVSFTVAADAGPAPDAGLPSDGGTPEPRVLAVGCGCQQTGALGLGVLGLCALRRQRRPSSASRAAQ